MIFTEFLPFLIDIQAPVHRSQEGANICFIFTGDIEGGSMVWRSTNDWYPCSKINPFPKCHRFKGNQTLVMIHCQNTIKFLLLIPGEKSVGTIRAIYQHIMFGVLDSGFNDVLLFSSYQSIISRMRIKSEYRNSRFVNTKIPYQGFFHNIQFRNNGFPGDIFGDLAYGHMLGYKTHTEIF